MSTSNQEGGGKPTDSGGLGRIPFIRSILAGVGAFVLGFILNSILLWIDHTFFGAITEQSRFINKVDFLLFLDAYVNLAGFEGLITIPIVLYQSLMIAVLVLTGWYLTASSLSQQNPSGSSIQTNQIIIGGSLVLGYFPAYVLLFVGINLMSFSLGEVLANLPVTSGLLIPAVAGGVGGLIVSFRAK